MDVGIRHKLCHSQDYNARKVIKFNAFNLLFNEITNLKFPPFLVTGRIITYPPSLQGG